MSVPIVTPRRICGIISPLIYCRFYCIIQAIQVSQCIHLLSLTLGYNDRQCYMYDSIITLHINWSLTKMSLSLIQYDSDVQKNKFEYVQRGLLPVRWESLRGI